MSMQRFGGKLRLLRQQRGLSQKKLADALGFGDQAFIHRLETGQKKPNVEHVLKISEFFGVTTDALMKDHLDVLLDDEREVE
jgi:transcriptional regulator with XRE-family HTH domain